MYRLRLLLLLLFSMLAAVMSGGCARCTREQAIAKLESAQGDVRRSEAAHPSEWNPTALGAIFGLGDGLRTAHAAEAVLGLDDGGKLRVRPDTTIRFANQRPAGRRQAFDVEAGQVMVETGPSELSLQTRLGVARVQANSRLLIHRSAEGLQYDVTVGQALFESSEGQQQVDAGQSYYVSVGVAVLDSVQPDAGRVLAPVQAVADAGSAPAALDGEIPAQVIGNGVSQKASHERSYQPVPAGSARLQRGALIRVQAGSSVELQQGGATVLLSGPSSYHLGSRDTGIELQNGKLSVTGASRIVVPGGIIETADSSSAAVETAGGRRTRVRVSKGWANVSSEKGNARVSAGEEATVSADGATQLAGRGLEYSDMSAQAGESFVVHDPRPPTAVRLQFAGLCSSGGVVRVNSAAGAQFASGDGSAALAFRPGRSTYTVHCLGDNGPAETAVAKGSITILKDAGTRPVPTAPPATSITTDGRDYTVMYQNQLPRIAVSWSNAPPSSSYTLHVESRGGSRTYTTESPAYSFASGALVEGHHTVYFEGAGRVSRRTGIEITFDNAAATASLATPAEPEVTAGGEITVAGTAQPGWSVEIGGLKIEQDSKQRFNQGVQIPTSQRAVAVKLTHPSRGTHVYLRRPARTP